MAYWLTKHWPLRKGDEKQSQAGVYVRPEDENIIKQVQPRDLVFIYETKGGKAELRKMADGTEELFPCRKGQGGIVALLEVTAKAFVREGSVPEKYSDGSTTWWKWFAPTKPVNTIGFVPREEVVRNLKYSPRYAFRGFGKNNSGLGRLTEEQFEALLFAFTSETGNNDEKTVQDARKAKKFGPGGEGPEHLALKECVAQNPSYILNEPGLRLYELEMPLPTADRIDVVLKDRFDRFVAVEIEVECQESELVGPLQCSKYRAMLSYLFNRPFDEVRTILVAYEIHDSVKAQCFEHGIETKVVRKELISVQPSGQKA